MERNTNIKEKGITLIALVITVVILIILATVTLNVVLGEGGLIERAQLAKDMSLNATAAEEEGLAKLEEEFANIMSEESIKNYEIVIGEESIIYDGEEQKPAIILKEGETVIPEEEYTVEYTNNINAGTGKITVTINGSGQTVEKEFTIEKRNVTITLYNQTVVEGYEIPDFGYTYDGLINSTDLKVKNRLIKIGDEDIQILEDGATANIAMNGCTILLEFEQNNNYNVTIIPGILRVNAAVITPGGSVTPTP